MGNCYEDTPLRYRKLLGLCPASEFQALLCNGYSITNGSYINDIWAEDNNFHDWPQNEKEWPIHCHTGAGSDLNQIQTLALDDRGIGSH